MKICRFNDDRVGVVIDGEVCDATAALADMPPLRWPLAHGDPFISSLDRLRPALERCARAAAPIPLAQVRLLSPVANPSKIVAAPVNYRRHLDEARTEPGIHHGQKVLAIDDVGVFLKATSSIVGAAEGVALRFTERRNDHEIELAAVIGRAADRVPQARALDYVAGYCIGLDMTVRGTEDRSLRKSVDSYTVLGPYLVTADEIPAPGQLDLHIEVNGERRQAANTRMLIWSLPKIIEVASSYYTLHPGDVILTGTPAGVGQVAAGDVMVCALQGVGTMTVAVRNA